MSGRGNSSWISIKAPRISWSIAYCSLVHYLFKSLGNYSWPPLSKTAFELPSWGRYEWCCFIRHLDIRKYCKCIWVVQRGAWPRASLHAFLYWPNPNMCLWFNHLFIGEPQIMPLLSPYPLTPPHISTSVKMKTRWWQAPKASTTERSIVALAPVSYQISPRKVLSPLRVCFPSGCPKETIYATRSTKEIMFHRVNLYQWNIEDGKELARESLFIHLTNCSKLQRFHGTSLQPFHRTLSPAVFSREVLPSSVTDHLMSASSSSCGISLLTSFMLTWDCWVSGSAF